MHTCSSPVCDTSVRTVAPLTTSVQSPQHPWSFTEVVGTCGVARQHTIMSCTSHSPQVNMYGMKILRTLLHKSQNLYSGCFTSNWIRFIINLRIVTSLLFWDTSIYCLNIMSFFIFLFLFILLLPLKWAATNEIFYRDKGVGQHQTPMYFCFPLARRF